MKRGTSDIEVVSTDLLDLADTWETDAKEYDVLRKNAFRAGRFTSMAGFRGSAGMLRKAAKDLRETIKSNAR